MQSLTNTRTSTKTLPALLTLALAGAGWVGCPVVALAGDATVAASASPAATVSESAKTAAKAPAKQWVWLKKQSLWGYGYQRDDGYWVVDPGSKRKPATRSADPYGFLGWLNSTRAAFGLSAVGHDPNLTNWASMNNAQQQARGLGHFVMGPARRQNAAMGSSGSIGAQWMSSPAHRAALLDPSIRWIGIAGMGAYWTFNAY